MPEVNLGKVVGPKGSDGAQGPAGADGLSAYEQAQAGGYSGSELEFNQQLAGLSDGPFVPESDKGVASGVATLDSTGKVPSGQLPSMDYIPTSQKGAASGVASLDATGKLKKTQKPDYTASEVGAVPTARTVNGKSLSADVVLTGEDIKTSATDNTPIGDVVSVLGGATTPQGALAALGAGVRPNIADNGNLIDAVNQRQFTSTTQAGRILDRWEISSDATINVTYTKGSGLLLQNLGSAGNLFLTQKRERKLEEEKKYTLSVLTDKGLFSDSLSPGESSYPTSGLYFSVVNRSGYGEFDIGVLAGGNSFLVKYVKVEDGEGQTLAYQGSTGAWQLLPQPESDYATQLLKCQRYYQIYSTADARPSKAVDCRPVMRTDPAQGTIVVGDTTYYYNTAEL